MKLPMLNMINFEVCFGTQHFWANASFSCKKHISHEVSSVISPCQLLCSPWSFLLLRNVSAFVGLNWYPNPLLKFSYNSRRAEIVEVEWSWSASVAGEHQSITQVIRQNLRSLKLVIRRMETRHDGRHLRFPVAWHRQVEGHVATCRKSHRRSRRPGSAFFQMREIDAIESLTHPTEKRDSIDRILPVNWERNHLWRVFFSGLINKRFPWFLENSCRGWVQAFDAPWGREERVGKHLNTRDLLGEPLWKGWVGTWQLGEWF